MSFDYSRLKNLKKHDEYYETDIDEYKKEWEVLKNRNNSSTKQKINTSTKKPTYNYRNKAIDNLLPTASMKLANNEDIKNQKAVNKNIVNDVKGVGSNFTRSIGNLLINAYQNIGRRMKTDLNNRMNYAENMDNKYLEASLGNQGYSEQDIARKIKEKPTLNSMAKNSGLLNNISEKASQFVQPFEEKLQDWEKGNNQKIQMNIVTASNPISKKIIELTPSIAKSSVNLLPGGSVIFSSAVAQEYYNQAKNEKGMTDEEADKYASIMASLESVTEQVGAVFTKNIGKSMIRNNIKSAFSNYGLDVTENFLEEAVMEPLEELTTTYTAGKEKANWNNIWQRSLSSGIDGALTSIIMGGTSAGVGSCIRLVENAKNGKTITQQEVQQAVNDAKKAGIDAQKVVADSLLYEKDKIINEAQKKTQDNTSNLQQNTPNNANNIQEQQINQKQNKTAQNELLQEQDIAKQNTDNKVIEQEAKTDSNEISQTKNKGEFNEQEQKILQLKDNTQNNLSKLKQFFPEEMYNEMQHFIETAPSEQALNQVNEDLKIEAKNQLKEIYKSDRFTESQDRKKTYAKYQREYNINGIEYNNEVVNNALDMIVANRNGKRTVGQWKQVAKQIGIQASDLSKADIDNIAYGSWFDLQPNKNITQYDNRTKEHKNFEKFTSDDWINTIYETAKEQKMQQLDTVLSNEITINQISQEQNVNAPEQIKIDSENFAKQVDNWKNGTLNPNTHLIMLKETPKIYRDMGLDNLPITLVANKLDRIYNETGKQKGRYHGLKELVKQLPEAISNPLNIVESTSNKDSIVIITELADKNNDIITVSLKLNGKGQIEVEGINKNQNVNVLTSAYGRENYDRQKREINGSWDGWMEENQKNNRIIYDIDEGIIKKRINGQWLELPNPNNTSVDTVDHVSTSNNSISQNKQDVKRNTSTNNIMQNTQKNIQQITENNNTKGETINWNEIGRPEENKKFRKHYRSIIESSNTTAEAKTIAKELMGTDTYVPESNKSQIQRADNYIEKYGIEKAVDRLMTNLETDNFTYDGLFRKVGVDDIALGERLIQYFSKTGDGVQLQNVIQATAAAGTEAGRAVQILSILNHQTPQGQATWIQRSVDKMNKELAKRKGGTITTDVDGNQVVLNKQGKDITDKVNLFELTPEMIEKIMSSENQEQMWNNIDEVYKELGQQVPKNMLEKIDSWRYFSMLANARTHIRNMVGNAAMGKMQRAKDKIAGGIEDVVSKFNPDMERTKTLRKADAKTKEFAKNDFKNANVQSMMELNENKYNPQSRLQNARKTFKSDALENTLGRLFNLNDKLLSAEDGIGLKAGYQKALTDYLTANKIDVDNITDAQLNKARNYAVQQAKEATFHQANAVASAITQFENKNMATKLFTNAILPFKKTPMNIAKAGIEYSPLQIAKSATIDLVNLRKGNISINQYIDNVSKGLTGTGIALVGYALANAGILKASGGDDKDKEKYDEEQGKQSYSIEIGGKTYSLDWLAPTGIPLFVGAETYKLFNQENTEKSTEKTSEENKLNQAIKGATNLLNAGATAINPMAEMSMISGLTSALASYNTSDNLGSLGNIATNAGKSYINQFVPTAMGQLAKTTDEYERTTKSTAKGTIGKAVDQTINQIKAKIPGLRQTLPIKTDIWGKDVKQEVNLPLRALNNFVNPATVKNISTDDVDKELNKLYETNSNSSILPDILQKKLTLNGTDYRWTNAEYAEYTKKYGQASYELINDLIKSNDYKNLTQEQKEDAIANIYSYAKEKNKLGYAEKVNEKLKPSTLYTTMEEIKKSGGNQSEYLNYLSKTKGMSKDSEKNEVLANSNYSNKTKEIIYANGTGKDDELYNKLLNKTDIDITEYLEYKNKVSSKAFAADKDSNGKTISGSGKQKVVNYLNDNITGIGNRLLIAGKSYVLQNSEKQKLAEYINKIATTKEERIELYKQLDKNFVVKDGKVYMKVSK